MAHFRRVNEVRRGAMLPDLLFSKLLWSVSANAANLGTGLVLLLAARAMRAGAFTIGDFALFVSYLGWLTQISTFFGNVLTQYRQASVSHERLLEALQGAPADSLTERPGLLSGPPASIRYAASSRRDARRCPALPPYRRRHVSSAKHCATTSCRGCRRSAWTCPACCKQRRSIATSRYSNAGSTRRSGRAA